MLTQEKTWTYCEITDAVERRIAAFMKKAEAKEQEGKYEESRGYKHWAYGVYLAWEEIARGYIEENDYERLLKLTEEQISEKEA